MHLDTYELIVAAIIYSENDKRVGCRPYQLLEHLRLALKQDDELHNAVVMHIEHTKNYVIELRVSCETNTNFVVIIQNERRDDKHFYCEHCLEANPPENYILCLGDSKSRTLTIYRIENDGHSNKGDKVRREKGDEVQGESQQEHKVQKSPSFLKRFWRNRAGSTHQLALSQCNLNEWHQNPLSAAGNHSIITFRILPKPDLNIGTADLSTSVPINNDFYKLTKSILEEDAEFGFEANGNFSAYEYSGDIADVGDAILDHTFNFCSFTHLCKRLLILAALLDWNQPSIRLSSRAIPHAIMQLRSCSFSKIEICQIPCEILSHSAVKYVQNKFTTCRLTSFFPPISTSLLHLFNKSIENVVLICRLEIWLKFPHLSPMHVLRAEIKAMIEDNVSKWLPECDTDLTLAIRSFNSAMCQFCNDYSNYFSGFGISYSEIVFTTVDQKLSECGQRTVKNMLKQLNSHNDEQLEVFTKINMKLFEAYKDLSQFAKAAKVKNKAIFMYEKWFEDCTIFWTYAWRILCRRYTLRALEEDINSCDEKVLPSAVNFLAIHKALCEDFVHLDLSNHTTALMCTLKIALIIADDLIIYAKRMQTAAKQFEPSKVLLAANSIEHTKTFALTRASELLNISKLLAEMPGCDSSQAGSSFELIIKSAAHQCDSLSEALINKICRERRESICKHCASITQCNFKSKRNLSWLRSVLSSERAEHLLAYLEGLSAQFSEVLFPRLSSIAHHQLLRITEQAIIDALAKGQPPAYYRQIEIDCDMVRRILQLETSDASPELTRSLNLNSLSTQQLILQYYTQLAELTENFEINANTPIVKLKIGYVRSNNQRITIFIHVVSALNIPILDTLSHSSDPFCRIELLPRFFFPFSQFPPQTTITRKQNLNPVWDQEFQITTTEETFFTNGSVLCVSLLDNDLLTYNDLAGQAYILLSRIPRVDKSPKKRPMPITLPLLLPTREQFQGIFQILVDRSPKNALAKEICVYERFLRDYRMLPPSANGVRTEHMLRRQKSKKTK